MYRETHTHVLCHKYLLAVTWRGIFSFLGDASSIEKIFESLGLSEESAIPVLEQEKATAKILEVYFEWIILKVKFYFSGMCANCEEAIHGEVCTAFGKTWHPYHFLCEVCGKELWQQLFYEREGKAYCEKDYTEKYSPKCEACKEIINDVRYYRE